jgi:hypothetical protein
MMKQLIILLTDSAHDRGVMLQEGNIKDHKIIYVECDEGKITGGSTIADAHRLLCVMLWEKGARPEENAARIVKILDQHKESYEAVVGTHNLGYAIEKALDVRVVAERYPEIPITQYTTVDYQFIKQWSIELSKVGTPDIDVNHVKVGFDKLFDLLKRGLHLMPSRRLALIKHRLSNLLLPIDNDLQGLYETGFAAEYWKDVNAAYKDGRAVETLKRVAQFIYTGDAAQETVEKICLEARHEFPSASSEIETVWNRARACLSREGVPANGEVKVILEDLGNPLKLETVRSKCSKYNNDFHAWFVSLIDALEELRLLVSREEARGSIAI